MKYFNGGTNRNTVITVTWPFPTFVAHALYDQGLFGSYVGLVICN